MEAERWRNIEKLYHAARDLQPSDRETFLEGASDSTEVPREVVSLLEQSESGRNPLDRPASGKARHPSEDLPADHLFRPVQAPYSDVQNSECVGRGRNGRGYQVNFRVPGGTVSGLDTTDQLLDGRAVGFDFGSIAGILTINRLILEKS